MKLFRFLLWIVLLSIIGFISIIHAIESNRFSKFTPEDKRTYYIDATKGNDSNNGTSTNSAWKSILNVKNLMLNPGDKVLFKRGEIWNNTQLIDYNYPSGTEENPIVFSSYGDQHAPLPILSSISNITFLWINTTKNIWKASAQKQIHRLFLKDKELLAARNFEELSLKQPWYWTNNTLYYFSESNPSNLTFKIPTKPTVYLENQSYINISNLDIQGGGSSALALLGSSNITIDKCEIGKYSSYGILAKNSQSRYIVKNLIIKNSIFDSAFTLDYSWILPSGKGAGAIGSSDGIFLGSGVQNSFIYNNYFKNWNHASISFETRSEYAIKNNEIYNNTLTAPDIDYGGRIGFSGNVTKNNIHHNLIFNIKVRNQIGGFNNTFHHNIIDGIKSSHLKNANIGQCISLEAYNGSVYNNTIEYNTLKNCDGAAINIIATGRSDVFVRDNIFTNNHIENCGRDTKHPENEIQIDNYQDIKSQLFINNYISKDLINYRGRVLNTTEFNNIDENHNNQRTNNNVGAGEKNLIGSTLNYK